MTPSPEQALQFAVMVNAGLPPSEAILYFTQETDTRLLAELTRAWQRSREVRKALASLMGRSWTEMSLQERCQAALDQHYTQLAYLLFSSHYAEAQQADKTKLDTARQALEAKLAGTAGKGDVLSQFFDDVRSGKVKLARPVAVLPSLES
jgi:hypothetical protein